MAKLNAKKTETKEAPVEVVTPVEEVAPVTEQVESAEDVENTESAEPAEDIEIAEDVESSDENAQDVDVDVILNNDAEVSEEVAEPKVEVEIAEPEEPVSKVEVNTTNVSYAKKPEERVKIRLRYDHRCTIAMEQYDFKKGNTYLVPRNVKNILNRAGLLSPL